MLCLLIMLRVHVVIFKHYSTNFIFPIVGCDVKFAGSKFFEGSRFGASELSLAFYSALYAYDGW